VSLAVGTYVFAVFSSPGLEGSRRGGVFKFLGRRRMAVAIFCASSVPSRLESPKICMDKSGARGAALLSIWRPQGGKDGSSGEMLSTRKARESLEIDEHFKAAIRIL
jgi:hypothetical protein